MGRNPSISMAKPPKFGSVVMKNNPGPPPKKPTGKLMWGAKQTLSQDTRVDMRGDLVTELTYKVPVEFSAENPADARMSKVVTAIENLLDNSYSNFLNVERCTITVEKDVYYIIASAIFTDHGPIRKKKDK